MKSTTDLLDQKHIFSQRGLLTEEQFRQEYNKRVLDQEIQLKAWQHLDLLHKLKVLIPFYRLQKKTRLLLPNEPNLSTQPQLKLNIPSPTIKNTEQLGDFIDPYNEDYKPWYSYKKLSKGGIEYWSSSFFYSPYQLLQIPNIRIVMYKVISKWNKRRNEEGYVFYHKNNQKRPKYLETRKEIHQLLILLSALEHIYLPELSDHFYKAKYINDLSGEIHKSRDSFNPVELLKWIEWTPNDVKNSAESLLIKAQNFDPLAKWHSLVELIHPEKWQELKGDALLAMDHKIAAEMLFRFYDDLVKVNVTEPIPEIPKYAPRAYKNRLESNPTKLNPVLMDFGISPYPSLVLILEGETEEFIVPLVMQQLGIPLDNHLIETFNAQGIGADFGLLARYVAKLHTGEERERTIALNRPPTRFMILVDAENKYAVQTDREKQKQIWVDRLLKQLPKLLRTETSRKAISDHLLFLRTWDDQTFEFAHFSDQEIAKAMIEVVAINYGNIQFLLDKYKTISKNDLTQKLTSIIGSIRSRQGNIEKISERWFFQPSKTAIAEILWPTLEKRIASCQTMKELTDIPIVRIILEAEELAIMTHRRNVVLET